ncbi:CRE-DSC-4 protein [Ditylenchus destructor]|uniref:CRE-DSC-4 protein n=1 Tax=Ditylenchus destructor TaxID=166010 RepID=A0AAD4MVX1_9BILA|nr:CRE-DSC-4 protein [Ditylenchus destructor]
MHFSWHVLPLFVLFAITSWIRAKEYERSNNFNDERKTKRKLLPDSEADDDKTRMLLYEYIFKSETSVFETNPSRAKGTVNGKALRRRTEALVEFKLFHYDDEGNILASYKLKKCIKGPCKQDMQDVIVDFSQGGHHLNGLYVAAQNGQEKPEHTLLTAIAMTVHNSAKQGEGESQIVNTPFGACNYRSSRPVDLRYERRINNCDFNEHTNHSLIDGITVFNYDQHVIYTQNQKIDADIIYIDAYEDFEIRSPLYEKWNLKVKSHTYMELNNRTRLYEKMICPEDDLAHKCAVDVLKSQSLGKDWTALPKKLRLFPEKEINNLAKSNLQDAVQSYKELIKNAENPDDNKQLRLFNEIVRASTYGTSVENILNDPSNHIILNDLLQSLASSGYPDNLKSIVRWLDLPAGQSNFDLFTNALAYTIKPTGKILSNIKDMMSAKRMHEDKKMYTALLYTTATLLRRRCFSNAKTLKACALGKEKAVAWFFNETTKCIPQDIECVIGSLNVLVNLPVKRICDYAFNFICSRNHSEEVNKAALRVVHECHPGYFTFANIRTLTNVYRNMCPKAISLDESLLAVDILFRIQQSGVSMSELIGSYLLLYENNFSAGRQEREKLAYFYDTVEAQKRTNTEMRKYWKKLRHFRAFRPNYSQRALGKVTSSVQSHTLANFPLQTNQHTTSGIAKVVVDKDSLAHLEYSIRHNHPSVEMSRDLFKLYVTTSQTRSHKESITRPEVMAQVSLLGHHMPMETMSEHPLFRNPVKQNIVYRYFDGEFPLLSGFSIKLRTIGSATIKTSHRHSDNTQRYSSDIGVVAMLDVTAELGSAAKLFGEISSELSLSFNITGHLDLNWSGYGFSVGIPKYCSFMAVSDLNLRHVYTRRDLISKSGSKSLKSNKKTADSVERTRTVPGVCYAPNKRIMYNCKVH